MVILITALGIIGFGLLAFAVSRVLIHRRDRKLNEARFSRVQELFNAIDRSVPLTLDDVLPYAKNPATRELTYQLLAENGKQVLFPAEYMSIEKAAESNLVNWLEYPTELDAVPDEIIHEKRVTIDFDGKSNFLHYEVFRFRVNEPHWAASDGWMLGVVGPYFDDSQPYDFPNATFSRLSKVSDNITPEEEVRWVHENIAMRGE